MRNTLCRVVGLLLIFTAVLGTYGVGAAAIPAGNLFVNPAFFGAEKSMPPQGWSIYGALDADRRISVINANDPEQRALLMEDMAVATGNAGEIGLEQTVMAGPGKYQAEMRARWVPGGGTGTVFFQVRFLPSNERQQISFLVENLPQDSWSSIVIAGDAPEGTTQVRVYMYTGQTATPSIAIQSISLVEMAALPEQHAITAGTNRVFYVAPTGRDNNPGTKDAPWASLQMAGRQARAGDTVIFQPGTYTGTLAPLNSGTPDAPITFKSAERHGAKLAGVQPSISVENKSHIIFEGFYVAPESTAMWAQVQRASYIEIKDSIFESSMRGVPFSIRESEQIQIRDNVFRHWAQDWSISDPVGIDTVRVYGSKYILLEGNAFSHGLHTPVAFRPQYEGRNEYAVVRGNVFHNGYGRNYEFFGTDMLLFENNIVTNGLRGARSADSANKFSPERGIYRFNRVFYNWGGPERMMAGYIDSNLQTSHDVRVYNNIFANNVAFGIQLASTKDKVGDRVYLNNVFAYNDIHGGHTQIYGTPGERFEFANNALWADVDEAQRQQLFSQSPYTQWVETLLVPPQFADDTRFDYTLQPDSALRDAGRFLTYAVGSGKGTIITVTDAAFFYDGFGIAGEVGDLIAVGSSAQQARVVSVDRENNQLKLDREVSWQDGAAVGFPWVGEAPDVGAYEHGVDGRPSVYIDASAVEFNQGEAVQLQAKSFGIAAPVQVEWRLDDGAFYTGAITTHTFTTPGDHAVFVQITDAEGRTYRGSTYVIVRQGRADAEDVLLHYTFDATDYNWWKVWKAYKPLPAKWSRVLDRNTGAGYLLVEAPGGNESGTLPAWIHPGGWDLDPYIWWDIDQFPYVDIRYRIQPGTPIGLYLEAFGGGQGRQVYLASTVTHNDTDTPRAGQTLLIDDGAWHEITVDVRWIRQVYPDVQVLQGIGWQTAPNKPSLVGSYAIDDVLIRSGAAGVNAPLVELRLPQAHETITGMLQIDPAVQLPLNDAVAKVEVDWAGERIYAESALPTALSYDTSLLPNGTYPLRVEVITQSGKSGVAAMNVPVRNWWEMVDNLQPPIPSTWFGALDRSQTSAASSGWSYDTETPAVFGDDADRIVWDGKAGEFLEWAAARGEISSITIELYTQATSLEESLVALATTADQVTWQPMEYVVEAAGRATNGWRKFVLRGNAADGAQAGWVRLTLGEANSTGAAAVQIGRVHIVGRVLAD